MYAAHLEKGGQAMNLLYAVIGIVIVIFFHELGHLSLARACNIRVRGMKIGFGNWTILCYKMGEVELSLTPWVLMGVLSFYPWDCDEKTNPYDPLSYKVWWKRFLTYAGGPASSILLGLALVFLASRLYGLPDYTKMVVERVISSSPAYNAGIRSGDQVLMLNGKPVDSHPGGNRFNVRLVLDTKGRRHEVPLSIDALIGVDLTPKIVRWTGISELWRIGHSIVSSLKLSRLADHPTNITGPITCLALLAKQHTLCGYLHLLGVISFGLGLANLIIPLPFLDGSRMLMALAEGVMRRPLAKRTYTAIYSTGGLLSLAVVGLVIWELWRLITPLRGAHAPLVVSTTNNSL